MNMNKEDEMDFSELIKERYSVREFKDTPIDGDALVKIIEAGRYAPTAMNYQPQRIYVLSSEDAMSKINSVCKCIYGAPTCLVIAYDRTRGAVSSVNNGLNYAEMDATIVGVHMMLQAAELGVGSCWVGSFSREEVHTILGLPSNEEVCALLPIGYAADGCKPSNNHYSIRDSKDTVTVI